MNNNKSFVKILNLMILTLSIFLCCGSAINQKDANAAQKLTTSEKLAGFKDDLTSEFVTKLSSIFNKIGKVFKLSLNSYYKIKDILSGYLIV